MPEFFVDRSAVPHPWDDPLAYTVRGEGLSIVAVIDAEAAAIFRSEIRGGGLALGQSTTDAFIAAVEGAVCRRYLDGQLRSSGSVTLAYGDVFPRAA